MRLARQHVPLSRRRRARLRPRHRRLRFEPLEARHLLAVLTVTSLTDIVNPFDELLTLREAISMANQDAVADTIQFADSLFDMDPSTSEEIQLGESGHLAITTNLTIQGPADDKLTIRAFGGSEGDGDGSRVFEIDDHAESKLTVTLANLTLSGGDADDDGGAIRSREDLTVRDVAITDSKSLGNGGGIFNMGGKLTVLRSTVSGNTARGGGGGIFSLGDLTVANSTVSGNTAIVDGGGIVGRLASFSIESSTVSGNAAGTFGGGVIFVTTAGRTARIAHSTITNNHANQSESASGSGGGVAALGGGALVIDHTIVAGNSDTRRGAADLSIALAAGFDALYSLIGNNQGSGLAAAVSAPDEDGNLIGTSGSAINPQLGPLGDNQGPTLTHALLKGSPAIDAGRPSAVPGQLGVPGNDQRGDEFARVVNGRLDIGAVEFKEVEPDGGGDGDGGGGNGGGGGGGDGGDDGGSEQDVFLFDGGSAAVEIQNPPVDADSENTVEVEVSLLNVIDPPAAQLFPNSDGGAGGGIPNGNQPQQVTGPEPVLDERVMQAVYYRAPVVHNEELVDAVFSLGEIEQVSLLGVDMGDEPVFRQPLKAAAKETADAVAEALGEPAPPIAQVPALEVPTAAGWRSLVLWAALAGSCTLWISGTWWWMHRGRKHPS